VRIGPYEVLEELGRGGMGVVYRVRTPQGGEAALKVLLKTDAATLARFERERRLLASLGETEGFVPLLDAGVAETTAWLVMPLVPGGTLREKLARGPLGVAETIELGRALARALGAAHERGIVHRDVKPENILFTAPRGSTPGRPLLADLGLAKHFLRGAQPESVSLSRTGELRGTAGYMAPEQTTDTKAVGPPADVFAAGAVLHECLAGHPAFPGGSVIEVLTKLNAGVVDSIGRPDVPPWLEAVIRRALASDPRARFADGAALARALGTQGAVGGPPSGAKENSRRAFLLRLAAGVAAGVLLLGVLVTLPGRSGAKPDPHGGKSEPRIPTPTLSVEELVVRSRDKILSHDWDGAIADATTAIELAPGYAPAWANRGSARANKGDLDASIADSTRAIELDPRIAGAWSNRGFARFMKGDWDGAIADSTRAIELDPRFTEAWYNRGAARSKKGDWEGAIADETAAIELKPGLASAWQSRGVARGARGDPDGEIADCTKAIELDPALAVAWGNLAEARYAKGDWEGAIADCTKAIEFDPRLAVAWYDRGAARGHGSDWEGDVADCTKALELDPRLAVAWTERASARAGKLDWAGAVVDATKAIEVDPARSKPWLIRGLARGQVYDFAGSSSDLEHFLELAPNDPDAPFVRGRLKELEARRGR
jgi:serine/threonine protein kinase/Flp pilus assembly protein TadD